VVIQTEQLGDGCRHVGESYRPQRAGPVRLTP
jgi:hypothetical protein